MKYILEITIEQSSEQDTPTLEEIVEAGKVAGRYLSGRATSWKVINVKEGNDGNGI